ncbi:MAG: type I glyceraldehyde-3-phosphate dehydrogenase [Lachnospiraceae bacterium]
MAIRVAINGFGRIGRIAFRQMFGKEEFDIVAVNGIENAEMAAYLLKYDSAQGRYELCDQVKAGNHSIIVGEKEIPLYNVRKAEELPWKEIGVDVVAECSGAYKTKEKAMDHINAGAKKVVISAPAGNDVPTIVYNVNHKVLKAEDIIISAASCTTNCLAPMADVLHKYAPIQAGLMTSIHAYTGDQKTLDAPHKKGNYRRARAAGVNIVPNSSGAAAAIGLVIPELNGKLNGSAQRVPVATGSSTLLMAVVKREGLTVEGINEVMKANANETLGFTTEDIVSSDIIGDLHGGVFDATQTMVTPVCDDLFEVQVVAWYDNESGYTSQMLRTIKYVAGLHI